MRNGVERPVRTQGGELPQQQEDKHRDAVTKGTSQQRLWIERARNKPYVSVQVMNDTETV